MKILLITSEEWNDFVYANGVLTNWFTDFDAEFAQIYTSPGKPLNQICDKYFQITDGEMAKSIITGNRAGRVINKPSNIEDIELSKTNERRKGIYKIFKNVSLYFNTTVSLIRDFIWVWGKYDKTALEKFVSEFKPDIVFCPRRISPKLIRLEKLVKSLTDAPFIAFTGDDEASMAGRSLSPLYWFRKYWINRSFRKHTGIYAYYLMHSEDQAKEYSELYGLKTSTIFKCGNFESTYVPKKIGKPIRLVYAGRLYCNRWKTLAEIGKALQAINKESERIVLDVYTQDSLSREQANALSTEKSIYIKGSVSPSELLQVYKEADIALHVESMDNYFRMVTRVSFSTKIIDLMSSTCAIMAICWYKHCGYQYLNSNDAAFCISDYKEILPTLEKICHNPNLIQEYALKAFLCGKKNHSRPYIQSYLKDLFSKTIDSNARR